MKEGDGTERNGGTTGTIGTFYLSNSTEGEKLIWQICELG
jgi:hypothetical protein